MVSCSMSEGSTLSRCFLRLSIYLILLGGENSGKLNRLAQRLVPASGSNALR
jgi:hypothetical protein